MDCSGRMARRLTSWGRCGPPKSWLHSHCYIFPTKKKINNIVVQYYRVSRIHAWCQLRMGTCFVEYLGVYVKSRPLILKFNMEATMARACCIITGRCMQHYLHFLSSPGGFSFFSSIVPTFFAPLSLSIRDKQGGFLNIDSHHLFYWKHW